MSLLRVLLLVAVALSVVVPALAAHSIPAQPGVTASAVSVPVVGGNGVAASPVALPASSTVAAAAATAAAEAPKVDAKYSKHTDFIATFGGVPINPTAHLHAKLVEDEKYVASVLRAPLDLGDLLACKHGDVERDQDELKKLALRINARRISLKQQERWIEDATQSLFKIESEIKTTQDTSANLAEQLDSLEAQKADLLRHVRRRNLMKELDSQSSNLMRLKDARMNEEITLQKKHNEFALRNHEHNVVLAKLNKMRTKQGLQLGVLADPKPYRFAQAGMEAEAEAEQEQQVAQAAAAELAAASEAEAETEAEQGVEAEAEVATEAASEQAAEAEAEVETETETEAEATTETTAEEAE